MMRLVTREFQVFAKPAGAACNMACHYCYYLDAAAAGQGIRRMPRDLLETYIAQHIEAAPGPIIRFSWHGGEPTILGLDYFRAIVALQRKHERAGRRVANGIQTNGLLLDDEWCRFFAAEGFTVGLSLDGPADLHDAFRVTTGGGPTHAIVMRALERLQRHRVACDTLCAVHDRNVRHPLRVYRFLRQSGARAISFLPVVDQDPFAPGGVSAQTTPADAYGVFLCTILDEWARRDAGRIAVQAFEEATRPARGLEHSLCVLRETCGEIPVVEHDGSFYSCDHFTDPGHRVGNIRDRPLAELLESPAQLAFGQAKRDTLPGFCLTCDVLDQCNGGCPKDRFALAPNGEPGLNYLCPGFKRFFRHAREFAAGAAAADRPPTLAELVPGTIAGHAAPGPERPGLSRNAPCPCGSGKKYKRCCING
jgi:uncharacterized protein